MYIPPPKSINVYHESCRLAAARDVQIVCCYGETQWYDGARKRSLEENQLLTIGTRASCFH